jgi:hypothetical protein
MTRSDLSAAAEVVVQVREQFSSILIHHLAPLWWLREIFDVLGTPPVQEGQSPGSELHSILVNQRLE